MEYRRQTIRELYHAPPPGPYLARRLEAGEELTDQDWRLLAETLRAYGQDVRTAERTYRPFPGGPRIRL